MAESILHIEDLRVVYRNTETTNEVVRGASLRIHEGEIVGLVGESGCGKSTVALAILRILSGGGVITGGAIRFRDLDLLRIGAAELQSVRWKEIAYVPQSALNAFNPMLTIETHLAETLDAHGKGAERQALFERALRDVGLAPDVRSYPTLWWYAARGRPRAGDTSKPEVGAHG